MAILKGERAVRATVKTIEPYAPLRLGVTDAESRQHVKDGASGQDKACFADGRKCANIIGENLSTGSTEATAEPNLAAFKITHTVTRNRWPKAADQ